MITLPWVARTRYEKDVQSLERKLSMTRAVLDKTTVTLREELDAHRQERKEWVERYDAAIKDNVERITGMVRDGFTPAPPSGEPSLMPDPLPPAITAAIAKRAIRHTPNERHLMRLAREMLDQGHEEKDIADAILVGEEVEL